MKKRIVTVILVLTILASLATPAALAANAGGRSMRLDVTKVPTFASNDTSVQGSADTVTEAAAVEQKADDAQPVENNVVVTVTETPAVEEPAEEEQPAAAEEEEPEEPEPQEEETCDGIRIYINGLLAKLDVPAIIIDSTTYVPVESFCKAMGAYSVTWDRDSYGEAATAAVSADGLTIYATVGNEYIWANGRYFYAPTGVRVIDGTFMAPARPLAAAFNSQVSWNGSLRAVYVTVGEGNILSAEEFYDSDDVYWLSRIIQAEAGNQSFLGKIAVGNVVMNRVKSPLCPNNVYDVIFDNACGVQFSPTANGTIYNTPSQESVIAAKIALEGYKVVGDCLFFASIKNCWAAYARTYYTTIGAHDFYL